MAQQQSLPAENSARADDIARALRQLRKWGFRITREAPPVDTHKGDAVLNAELAEYMGEAKARCAACTFLGLEGTEADMTRYDVHIVAQALEQNSVDLPYDDPFEALLSNQGQK